MRYIILIFALFFVSNTNQAFHKFYVSITTMRHNPESEKWEVTMKLFADDLEDAIESNGAKTYLGTDKEIEEIPVLINTYINETFVHHCNELKVQYEYLGKELEEDIVYLYFESEVVENCADFQLKNEIFIDLFDQQANMLQIEAFGQEKSLVFNKGDKVQSTEL